MSKTIVIYTYIDRSPDQFGEEKSAINIVISYMGIISYYLNGIDNLSKNSIDSALKNLPNLSIINNSNYRQKSLIKENNLAEEVKNIAIPFINSMDLLNEVNLINIKSDIENIISGESFEVFDLTFDYDDISPPQIIFKSIRFKKNKILEVPEDMFELKIQINKSNHILDTSEQSISESLSFIQKVKDNSRILNIFNIDNFLNFVNKQEAP